MARNRATHGFSFLVAVLALPPASALAAGNEAEGRIIEIGKQDRQICELNIGTESGLVKGSTLDVFDPQNRRKPLGQLTVVTAEPNRSAARGGPFSVGLIVVPVAAAGAAPATATAEDMVGKLANVDGVILRVVEVIRAPTGKGIRAVKLIDPNVEARIRGSNMLKTQIACEACRGENKRCPMCGGSGFVIAAQAIAQLVERAGELKSAGAIRSIKLQSGFELAYDPQRKVLTDPQTAAEGTLLYEKELAAREAERQRQREAALAAQRAAEEARRKAAELARKLQGDPVKVVNSSKEKVGFVVMAIADSKGKLISVGGADSKPHLVTGLEAVNQALGGAQQPKPLRWDLAPGETAELQRDGAALVTSQLHYRVYTGDLFTQAKKNHENTGSDFVISLGDGDLHTPVLVNVGPWKVEQDIWYTTHEGKTPTTITKEQTIFGKDYYVVHEGEKFEYEKKHKGGMATASAAIENPTDKVLDVKLLVEFTFAHVLLSHQQVTAQLAIRPGTTSTVYVQVDTKALIGNREATAVRVIDVTTTPK